jgi:hypothetical protein
VVSSGRRRGRSASAAAPRLQDSHRATPRNGLRLAPCQPAG